MDNLKSPYWEIYFWIAVIAIGIAGTAIIFIDPEGKASKFGNAGSFLGGLFTIAAVVIAIITLRKMQSENEERLKFDTINQLEIEIIPKIVDVMIDDLIFIKEKIYQLKTPEDVLNADDKKQMLDKHESFKSLINQYKVKLKYLEKNIGVNVEKIEWEVSFSNFTDSFNYLLQNLSIEYLEIGKGTVNTKDIYLGPLKNHIYNEYIESSIHLEKGGFVYDSRLKFIDDVYERKNKVIAYLHSL